MAKLIFSSIFLVLLFGLPSLVAAGSSLGKQANIEEKIIEEQNKIAAKIVEELKADPNKYEFTARIAAKIVEELNYFHPNEARIVQAEDEMGEAAAKIIEDLAKIAQEPQAQEKITPKITEARDEMADKIAKALKADRKTANIAEAFNHFLVKTVRIAQAAEELDGTSDEIVGAVGKIIGAVETDAEAMKQAAAQFVETMTNVNKIASDSLKATTESLDPESDKIRTDVETLKYINSKAAEKLRNMKGKFSQALDGASEALERITKSLDEGIQTKFEIITCINSHAAQAQYGAYSHAAQALRDMKGKFSQTHDKMREENDKLRE